MDDDLLPIGRFARLAGLSVGALRHYDELDLLRPADIDRFTGYRRYGRTQLETARTIARLRDLELPLDEIRAVLTMDDPAAQRRRLAAHRARIEARTNRLQRLLHVLRRLGDGKDSIMTDATATMTAGGAPTGGSLSNDLDPATHRQLGVELYNSTWALLEKADRTAAETDEMIHRAHASRWHWGRVGEAANLARGEWLCSRVYATLGRGEPALWHAQRCLEINDATSADARDPWDLPAAYEAMARASFAAGDPAAGASWKAKAVAAVAAIPEADDREILEGDIATLP